MIKECKVEAYAEKYICDECKIGEMLPNEENMWLTDPPRFKHVCNKCGKEQGFNEKYPCIKFRIIND